jgi:DegV family protein with EDD domain
LQKVAIVVDSIACLTWDLVEQYRIEIVPIMLLVQGKVYRDMIDMTPSQAYELFLKEPESFNTSPASPGHYLEAYREASNKAEKILCITLSSELSTGYDVARTAREQAKYALPETTIEVLDSRNVTASEGLIALAAARAAAEGKDLPEVLDVAEKVKEKATFFILLDTIRHVYRTGRIPKVASQVGSMLNIKPILTTSSGLVKFKGVARNREQGIERLIRDLREKVGQNPVHIAVMHAYCPDEAEELKKRLDTEFNCIELFITEFTPVMGYATGTGTLGFAFYQED